MYGWIRVMHCIKNPDPRGRQGTTEVLGHAWIFEVRSHALKFFILLEETRLMVVKSTFVAPCLLQESIVINHMISIPILTLLKVIPTH